MSVLLNKVLYNALQLRGLVTLSKTEITWNQMTMRLMVGTELQVISYFHSGVDCVFSLWERITQWKMWSLHVIPIKNVLC
jgi:hypothetical protein